MEPCGIGRMWSGLRSERATRHSLCVKAERLGLDTPVFGGVEAGIATQFDRMC